jgi:hypothetical protein
MAWPPLRAGRIEELMQVGNFAHPLISFARASAAGRENATFFAERAKLSPEAAAPG